MSEQVETSVPIDKYNRVVELLRVCTANSKAQATRIVDLERQLTEKERLLEEMGKRLAAAETLQSDTTWREKLAGVSFGRVPTPQKKILEYLRDRQLAVPHTEHGDFQEHTKTIAKAVGMCEKTVQNHLKELDEKGAVDRRYEGNGESGNKHRDATFYHIPDEIMRNPFHLHKIIPVEREPIERRGGNHPKQDRTKCPACGSGDINAHESGYCNKCSEVWLVDLTGNRERPPSLDPMPEPEIAPEPQPIKWPEREKYNLFYVPPRPNRPCTLCGEKCWTIRTEESGEKWWASGCELARIEKKAVGELA